jgi:hypothetical protein
MKTRVALVLLAVSFLLTGCYGETYVLRYRLTLEVETPQGIKTGSGVIQTTWMDQHALSGLAGGAVWAVHVKGEAFAVGLGNLGDLFVLMALDIERRTNGLNSAELVASIFGHTSSGSTTGEMLTKIAENHNPVELPLAQLPMLVRFRDVNDPASVERVDPEKVSLIFGPNVKLIRATIQITDDPVSEGIEKTLPWLSLPWPEVKKLLQGPYWNNFSRNSRNFGGLQLDDFKEGF